ncbi:MAG: helix-turn-helix transcriptional regulator [Eubacterium sp.]|nr:helix-turn-helix transcriptional regulator [Eubacterium sp.]
MAVKKVGELIREARTGAGLTQEALAKKITGLSAADLGKAERGEKDLTQEQLKAIAKATGVTQKSLLDAARRKTTSTGKTGTAAKKPAGTSAKKPAATSSRETLTAAEKKFLQLYRDADAKSRSLAKEILEGKTDTTELLLKILGKKVTGTGTSSSSDSGMSDLLGSLLGNVLGKK